MRVVEIDGSMGEGGGQILRYSLALSALTLRPVRIYNIRAKRDNPGLRPQHLTAVNALKEVTNAVVRGAEVGSMELYFEPRERRGGFMRLDIGTAGSISLVMQAMIPVLLFSEREARVQITGGTDVEWSPPIDYMKHVFAYNMRLLGVEVKIDVLKRGHYPRGGGLVEFSVKRATSVLKPVKLVEHGGVVAVRGVSHAVRLPKHVAERQASSAASVVMSRLGVKPTIELEYYEPGKDHHLGPGSGIVLYAETRSGTRLGADSLGAKGKPAERVGAEAAEALVEEVSTGMCFDRHMGDMLVPYLALAGGQSEVGVSSITLHTLTAVEVVKMFFPEAEIRVEGGLGKPGIIKVKGVSYQP
ncbi:RNA 3'-terminal phosphate cyclase [Thermogladius sp.]|uniref:RNA 3'-terminal phosphate cyclase n=1 Tax=Thermogladius sp. TaxID=2023064 RepID=UPI003D13BB0C